MSETLSGSFTGFKALIVNQDTGEVLIQDAADLGNVINAVGAESILLDAGDTSDISHEVEVVTVQDIARRSRVLREQRYSTTSTTQSIVKPLVSSLPGSSSGSAAAAYQQSPRSTPTLLRNSRFARQSAIATIVSSPQIYSQTPAVLNQTLLTGLDPSLTSTTETATIEFIDCTETVPTVGDLSAEDGRIGTGGDHQLIVYSGDGNEVIIPDDQIQICGVLQPEDGNQSIEGSGVVRVITDDNGQLKITKSEDGETIYFCQGPDDVLMKTEPGGSDTTNGGFSTTKTYIQDQDGNVYEIQGTTTEDLQAETSEDKSPMFNAQDEMEDVKAMVGSSKRRNSAKRGRWETLRGSPGIPDGSKRKPLHELACLEPNCSHQGHNILDLRNHLKNVHGFALEEDTMTFKTYDEFKAWREEYEKERMVSFIFRGGTKKVSQEQAVTYMICHRSGHYKPSLQDTGVRKRKLKPQGSCKINGYCTAGIKLLKNLVTGEVKCEICHTHYGHPLDEEALPHLRVTNSLRKVIYRKFKEGFTLAQMMEYLHHNQDQLEGIRLLDRRAIRNLYDKFQKGKSLDGTLDEALEEAVDHKTEDEESPTNDVPAIEPVGEAVAVEESEDVKPFAAPSVSDTSISTVDVEKEDAEPTPGDADDDGSKAPKSRTGRRKTNPTTGSTTASASEGEAEVEPGTSRLKRKQQPSVAATIQPTTTVIVSPKEDDTHPRRSGRERKPKVFDDELPAAASTLVHKPAEKPVSVGTLTSPAPRKGVIRRKAEDEATGPPVLKKQNQVPAASEKEDNNESPPPILKAQTEPMRTTPPVSTRLKRLSKASYQAMRNCVIPPTVTPPFKLSAQLENTIRSLQNHNDTAPTVLLFKLPGVPEPEIGDPEPELEEDDFVLILQTPVQRDLIRQFPDILCIDGHHGKAKDLKVGWIMIIDEFREAIPAAWLIASQLNERIWTVFLRVIRLHCGELDSQAMLTPTNNDYTQIWNEVFESRPRRVLNEEEVKRDLRVMVAEIFADNQVRSNLNEFMTGLVYATKEESFNAIVDQLKTFLTPLPGGLQFFKTVKEDWIRRAEEWSLLHMLNKPLNLLHVAESFGKLKKFTAFKGTKTLSQSIDPILKIGYDKCFARMKRIYRGDQKVNNAILDLQNKHHEACQLSPDLFVSLNDGHHFLVKEQEGNVAYTVVDLKSPCRCRFICPDCGICIHNYICSCTDSAIEHEMCTHIHFVHLMQVDDNEPDPSTTVSGIRLIRADGQPLTLTGDLESISLTDSMLGADTLGGVIAVVQLPDSG